MAGETPTRTEVKTLLLTDLVDSTRMVAELGDREAAAIFARADRAARDLLSAHAGREIDKSDGFLLLFERPIEALQFAIGYHDALSKVARECDRALSSRSAIHLGEVIVRENDPDDVRRGAKPVEVEGLAKPMTARILGLAQGGQTLMTRSAFDLARRAATDLAEQAGDLEWLAHGPYLLKGVDEPVELYEVGRRGEAPLAPPQDSEKARRALGPGEEDLLGWRPSIGATAPHRSHWKLMEKLGEGGFGEAWLVQHDKTGERRVYKYCFNPRRLSGLKREVALFRLMRETLGERRDISRLLDWNFDEAPYFLEAEYTAGGNLPLWAAAQVNGVTDGLRALPLHVRLEIVARIADALAAAHSVGVLHKDIKPSNILVAEDGGSASSCNWGISDPGRGVYYLGDGILDTAAIMSLTSRGFTTIAVRSSGSSNVNLTKSEALGVSVERLTDGEFKDRTAELSLPSCPRVVLSDFGIGLLQDRDLLRSKGITASGFTQDDIGSDSARRAGSALYMAPEFERGEPPTISSDIFALGVLLYQVVVGEFGRSLSLGWDRDITDDLLADDIRACVEPDPHARLHSARDLAVRLRGLDDRHSQRAELRRRREEMGREFKREEGERRRREREQARKVYELLQARYHSTQMVAIAGWMLAVILAVLLAIIIVGGR